MIRPFLIAVVATFLILPGIAQDEAKVEEKQQEPPPPVSAFPDKALEKAVRAEVFSKRNNEEPITAEDVKNISRVVGKKKGITNLEGLQHCHAIMLIDLEDNEISETAFHEDWQFSSKV